MANTERGLTQAELEDGFARLGLAGQDAVIHSSLRSFGHVEGGADTVVNAIARTFQLALLPAFCFDSSVAPPPNDRPAYNGYDYARHDQPSKLAVPFRVESAAIDSRMGVIPCRFATLPGVMRSDHPWHSWIGRGPGSAAVLQPHPWDTTNLPLERLADRGAFVVLAGVGLTACTAVHVAEERAGRRPFIRWAIDRDGVVRRVSAAGCSKGFGALEPHCADVFIEQAIGESRVRVARLSALIERCAEVIRVQPEITVCSDTCLRCRDSVRGGVKATARA